MVIEIFRDHEIKQLLRQFDIMGNPAAMGLNAIGVETQRGLSFDYRIEFIGTAIAQQSGDVPALGPVQPDMSNPTAFGATQ
jgi:hypothetical protein